jgi:hypothetical protein
MWMKRIQVILSLMLLAATAPANAQDDNFKAFVGGNELHQLCKNDILSDIKACDAYVMGFVDTLLKMMADDGSCYFKLRDGVTVTQICDIARKYLRDHPGERHNVGVSSLMNAMQAAFPC